MPASNFFDFPNIDPIPEEVSTRPIPLHNLSRQVQIERNMAVIRAHHARIADAINLIWDHKECAVYLEQLILSGGDGLGRVRIGFKQEVIAAFMNLIDLLHVK